MREIFIEESYADQSILITGSTGFIGKVLVEKLLRECKRIKKIYILLRSKKGDGLEKRFEDFKNLIVFNDLKKSDPDALSKIAPIEGDFLETNCGISITDQEFLASNINIIIHCAASVKFDEPLKLALKMNTISTKFMLDLAEKCENFKAFVHVSTAFSNTNQSVIYEKIYEPICDYKHVISLAESDEDEKLNAIQELALETYPNTYIFTKNLTEKLVSSYENLPVSIVRPSIVCPSYKSPYIGWVDSLNGPMGVLLGASSGILRTVHGNGNLTCDLIPCDFVINCIIAAGASISSSTTKALEIYNCTSSKQMPITWNQFLDLGRVTYMKYPSTKVLWYPGGRMCANYHFYLLYFTLFQLIPAFVIDACAMLAGKKRWAIKLQKRIFESLKVFEYFLNHEWQWECKNYQLLTQMINIDERNKFDFDIATLDFPQYVENWIIGSRRFIMKLDDSSIEEAKRKFAFLFWLDLIVKAIFFFGFAYIFIQIYTRIAVKPTIKIS